MDIYILFQKRFNINKNLELEELAIKNMFKLSAILVITLNVTSYVVVIVVVLLLVLLSSLILI